MTKSERDKEDIEMLFGTKEELRAAQKKAQRHAYYVAHRDKERAANQAWRAANKERINARQAIYRANNKERIKAYRLWYYNTFERGQSNVREEEALARKRWQDDLRSL